MHPDRFKVILAVFILFFIGIVIRLFQLQLMESDKYKGISKNRRIATYPLEAIRGTIFDRNGKILAMDQHTFDISVPYKNLLYSYMSRGNKSMPRIADMDIHKKAKKACSECHENQDMWIEEISRLLKIPQDKLLGYAEKIIERVEKVKRNVEQKSGRATRIKEETDHYPIVSDIDWEKVIQIEINQDSFRGVRIVPKPKRVYPGQELASHVLGYMGRLRDDEWREHSDAWNNFILNSDIAGTDTVSFLYDGYAKDDYIGRAGIEAQYEEELRGLRGKRFEEITCKNTQVEKVILERPPVSGNDIYLTIDSHIQAHAEESLGTNRGSIIVMDPRTGEILAMANNPRFNPNTVNEDFNKLIKHPLKPFLNRAVQGALPPGSTFKIFTAIAAMDLNHINKQTTIDCCGYSKYKNITFKCWSSAGHGLVTIEDAIPYSCNVFFFEVAKILGGDSLYSWSKKFAFGEKTGIDLPYEKRGNLPKLPTVASGMNVGIGQGALLTTPLQMVRAYAAIANGGFLVQPRILLKRANSQGEVLRAFKSEKKQILPIRPGTLDTIRLSLQEVVTRGTAKNKGLEIYKVAGKTGTAETGRQKDNHAWFVGYAPHDNPRYCFSVLIEHTPGHGAEIACPIVEKLMSFLFPEINQAS